MKHGHIQCEEFFRTGRKITIIEDVQEAMAKDREAKILDPSITRRQEAWSQLASEVVGAESK